MLVFVKPGMEANPCRLGEVIGAGREAEEMLGVIAEGLFCGGVEVLFFWRGIAVSKFEGPVGYAAEEEASELAGFVLTIDGCLENIGLDVAVEGDVTAFKGSGAIGDAEAGVPVTIEELKELGISGAGA